MKKPSPMTPAKFLGHPIVRTQRKRLFIADYEYPGTDSVQRGTITAMATDPADATAKFKAYRKEQPKWARGSYKLKSRFKPFVPDLP